MQDNLGRTINYLRLSITDRCNFRCRYCMPAEGVPLCEHDSILRYEDLLRISRVAAELGIEKVRVTGGEPLVRKGVIGFLQQLKEIHGITEVAVTTNGALLSEMSEGLKAAGVERLNISLDSLQPQTYESITRGGDLSQTLHGLEQAEQAGLKLKLNMVVMRGVNDQEVENFAALSIERPWSVRFIEYMPTIREKAWRSRVIPGSEVLARIQQLYELEPLTTSRMCGPARPYRIRGALGTIGIITPMSEHFCGSCNRIRVTSRGFAKSCLLSEAATDLRPFLQNSSDDELRSALIEIASAKGKHHHFLADGNSFSMSSIGG